jgi:hypothetical protein
MDGAFAKALRSSFFMCRPIEESFLTQYNGFSDYWPKLVAFKKAFFNG